jgi:hypothetical protein
MDQEALALYGWYTMLVYLMSIPGGMIADKLIGQKKAVLVWCYRPLYRSWCVSAYSNLGIL